MYDTKIVSSALQLLLVQGLRQVYGFDAEAVTVIINQHLAGDRDIFACQQDLIDAGYERYATL